MLTTTPWLELDRAPGWLGSTVALLGFLAFLVLAGFATLVGNALAGLTVLVVLRRGWRWPMWRAALVALPYWIVFYRLVPKPW
ncbi:hypothetical protein OPKNFCMD_2467 [Methylobacterium crusticola]|uniref:Uncharacterized protein n=1 Tax=Methylobacterium crusticola TaxID=1697972 RepID=A0ABQ4QXT0_9HYPH|nr:hypothetical protein [Methylobacterium crusticola]GJD49734.1 hypothetical protein OPKNFCMD_2467 [Methylobacterium crusticola]